MVLTLLTDFGAADYFVGAMKGVILGRAPGATIVDLTHEIPPQDVRAAAFTLFAAYGAFPAGTVHLAVVDPGVGSERRAVAATAGGHLFVAPDNGLLGWVLDREPDARVVNLTEPRFFRHPVSTTFHGRDVFAPVAAALAAGTPLHELGSPIDDPLRLPPLGPVQGPDGGLEGEVIHVDRFGNCVTSLSPAHLPAGEPGRAWGIEVAGHEVRSLRRFYAEDAGRADEPFMILGSAGLVEVSLNGGSAARRLGVERGAVVRVIGDAAG